MSAPLLVAIMSAVVVVAGAAPLAAGATRAPFHRAVGVQPSRHPMSLPPRGRRRERMLDDAYPDALDLFVVSVQAGQLPLDALVCIGPHVHPVIADAIAEVQRRVGQGQRLALALDALVEALGSRALAFVSTLVLAERTGLAVAPMIDRIGDDARLHRRRRAEASARELPVRLSVPLVLCTLPSFVLVAIAPLLIGALSSLRGT